jgi:hypothetical protein
MEYCKLLLKCFLSMTKNYENFDKYMIQDYKIYVQLIKTSLSIAHSYHLRDNEKNKHDQLYYSLILKSAKTFLYLIENYKVKTDNIKTSEKTAFAELKPDLIEIFKLFSQLYSLQENANKKIELHIFYTFLVTRILAVLNRDKAFDFYNYEEFYRTIFNYRELKPRIDECIGHLCLSPHSTNSDEVISKFYNTNGEFLNFEEKELKANEDIFLINFLTIYTIYLNELNSAKQKNSNKLSANSQKIKIESLINKINSYLDKSIKDDKENLMKLDTFGSEARIKKFQTNNNIKSYKDDLLNINLFKKKGKNKDKDNNNGDHISRDDDDNSNTHHGDLQGNLFNDYSFEIIILQSILFYKHEKNLIETKINSDKRNYYYYYEIGILDTLLLEKMLKEMNVYLKITNICKINYFNIINKY